MTTGGEETYDVLNRRSSLESQPKTECIRGTFIHVTTNSLHDCGAENGRCCHCGSARLTIKTGPLQTQTRRGDTKHRDRDLMYP